MSEQKRDREEEFNLITILDELPAAQYLWYDNVPHRKKMVFKKKLVKLMKLFVTPHVTEIYPYLECSFLKKYEAFHSLYSNSQSDIINFLGLENTLVELVPEMTIVLNHTNTSFTLPRIFVDSVVSWYNNTLSKPILLLSLNMPTTMGHSVFIIFKKYEGVLKFLHFDSHGYESNNTSTSSLKVNVWLNAVKQQLSSHLQVPVREVISSCPTFQLQGQGGNCKQWFLLVFAFFMKNPSWFDDPTMFLNYVARHATLNIMLFSLAMFLRLMHFYGLENYYFYFIKQVTNTSALKECIQDDRKYRDLLSKTLYMQNCNDLNVDVCPVKCATCDNRCAYKVAVKTEDGKPCKLLNPQEIAHKMFELYFDLQKLVLHVHPNSFNKLHMSREIARIRLPKTLQDYVVFNILTPPQLVDLQHIQEAQILRRTEIPKLSRKIEELYENLLLIRDHPLFERASEMMEQIMEDQSFLKRLNDFAFFPGLQALKAHITELEHLMERAKAESESKGSEETPELFKKIQELQEKSKSYNLDVYDEFLFSDIQNLSNIYARLILKTGDAFAQGFQNLQSRVNDLESQLSNWYNLK